MKDNIQIGLLTLIAGMLVYQIATRNTGATTPVPAPTAMTAPAANPFAQPAKSTFDPATPPATPITSNAPRTAVKFAKDEYDFGKVISTSENTYKFAFTNTGSEPLIIENAQGSCGCTVPEYPKAPIPPGGSGEIKVVYKPNGQSGAQQKTVTVTANTEPNQTVLRIKADVTPDPNAPAPAAAAGSPVIK
jgi:hypothetical protein